MTQFQRRTHPAVDRLQALGRSLPGLWQEIEDMRRVELPPADVYLTDPMAAEAMARVLVRTQGREAAKQLVGLGSLAMSRYGSNVCTLASWRMTQGIYRVDPALYPTLIDTELRGDLPAEALTHLPEWCLYVETPGLTTPAVDGGPPLDVRGAWVRLAIEPNGSRVLVVGPDIAESDLVLCQFVPLIGTLQSSIEGVIKEWQGHPDAGIAADPRALSATMSYLQPIINILLYIIGVADDVRGKNGQPGNPVPVRTRRDGWKLFAAEGLRVWDVGVRMGAALRRAYAAQEAGLTGGGERAGVRAHVRRSHWHGFRSGPKKRADGSEIPTHERTLEWQWLPPIPVNVDDFDSLPATIRPVK